MKIMDKIKKYFWYGDIYEPLKITTTIEEMTKDPQIKSCINIKKMLILQGKQEIHKSDKSQESQYIRDFTEEVLYKSQGTITDLLFNVMDAFVYGFSVNEIVYKKNQGKIEIEKFSPIDPRTINFEFDIYGNMKRVFVNDCECPRNKLIIYSYNSTLGNPWGQSDLLSIEEYYKSKKQVMEYFRIYLEKYVSPVIKGSYKRGLTSDQQQQIINIMKTIKQKTCLLIPEEVKLENMNLNTGGGDSFRDAIDYYDRQIAKGILGQTIFTNDNVTVGSYSLANIHLELLTKCLNKIKNDLEEGVVTEQIIKPLVKMNFGTNLIPRFTISDISPDNLKKNSEAVSGLISKGIIEKDEFWLREFLGIPENRGEKNDIKR